MVWNRLFNDSHDFPDFACVPTLASMASLLSFVSQNSRPSASSCSARRAAIQRKKILIIRSNGLKKRDNTLALVHYLKGIAHPPDNGTVQQESCKCSGFYASQNPVHFINSISKTSFDKVKIIKRVGDNLVFGKLAFLFGLGFVRHVFY